MNYLALSNKKNRATTLRIISFFLVALCCYLGLFLSYISSVAGVEGQNIAGIEHLIGLDALPRLQALAVLRRYKANMKSNNNDLLKASC